MRVVIFTNLSGLQILIMILCRDKSNIFIVLMRFPMVAIGPQGPQLTASNRLTDPPSVWSIGLVPFEYCIVQALRTLGKSTSMANS
jgi:hypothetical protein